MELSISLFGKGGFGVHAFGRVIREAFIGSDASLYVALAVEYDTVVRGGISNCHLIVSEKSCNPVVEGKSDVSIYFKTSWAILRTREEVCYLSIPREANQHISESVRGYVLLGMLVARQYIPLSKEAIQSAILIECRAPRMLLMNHGAFEKGLHL